MVTQDGENKRTGDLELLPAEELLAALHGLLQNVRIHQENNVLVVKCIDRLRRVAGKLFEETDDITLQIAKGKFYIGGEKLGYRRGSALLAENMMKFMERRGVVGLQLYPPLLLVPGSQIVALARFLNESLGQKNPMDWLVLRLEEAKFDWVALLQPEIVESGGVVESGRGGDVSGPGGSGDNNLAADPGGPGAPGGSGGPGGPGGSGGGEGVQASRRTVVEAPGHRSPRRLYAYALEAMREVAGKISGKQRAGVRNAVRIVQNMVEEVILQEQPLLLAMSTIRVYDDYTFSHSVNVAILSIFMGKKIGVNKDTLECLGICGLFHDLGKVLVPVEILHKVTPLTPGELAVLRTHSLNSVRLIMRLRATARRKSAIIMPPLEHHLRYDLSGYPDIGWRRPLTLCGRILAICDNFDALTSPRIYRNRAYSADQALGMMLALSGTAFDPLLLKVFINILGVYPIGTLLELDNGDIGLVCRSPETPVMSRPWVLLLRPDGRGGFSKGEEVNLAAKDRAGFYYRSAVNSANPALFNIQPAEFLT